MAKKEQINIRIEPETKKAFADLCASKRPPVTMSAYIEYLIREELDRHTNEIEKTEDVQ